MREFEKGSILSHLIFLSWPMVFANLIQNGLAMFEIFLLGKLGVSALAAFAIGAIVNLFFWSFQGGIVTGCIAISARLNGEKEHEKLNRAIVQMLIFGTVIPLLFAVLIFLGLRPIITFFGGKGETFILAYEYIPLLLAALTVGGMMFVFVGVLRGVGDSVTPLKFVLTAVVINIIAAPVFIFGAGPFPQMGIKGAAAAMLAGFGAAFIISLIVL